MNQPKSGSTGVLRNASEVGDLVTPLPSCESHPIIPPSLSMKQRRPEDRSLSLVRRSAQQQREFEDRVSGPEAVTDSSWAIGLVYINENRLPTMEFLYCAIMHYIRTRGVAPGCLYVSSDLQNEVRSDIQFFSGKPFVGTISFPSGQEAIQYIPVHFFSDLGRDQVMGYASDCI